MKSYISNSFKNQYQKVKKVDKKLYEQTFAKEITNGDVQKYANRAYEVRKSDADSINSAQTRIAHTRTKKNGNKS